MTINNFRGKTFEIQWAWAPVGFDGDMMVQLRDERPLAQIAADFEGCDFFLRESPEEGDMEFEGFTRLRCIQRTPDGSVRVLLMRRDDLGL